MESLALSRSCALRASSSSAFFILLPSIDENNSDLGNMFLKLIKTYILTLFYFFYPSNVKCPSAKIDTENPAKGLSQYCNYSTVSRKELKTREKGRWGRSG
jgi:hypothetical protein